MSCFGFIEIETPTTETLFVGKMMKTISIIIMKNDELLFAEGSEAFKPSDSFSFPCVQCETFNFWNAPLIFNEVSASFRIQYMNGISV